MKAEMKAIAKVKLSLCMTEYYAMKIYWNVSGKLRPLYPRGKAPSLHPLDKKMGGPQNRSVGYRGVKILDPTENRTPIPRSSRQ
jgi:hypothetical protein